MGKMVLEMIQEVSLLFDNQQASLLYLFFKNLNLIPYPQMKRTKTVSKMRVMKKTMTMTTLIMKSSMRMMRMRKRKLD